MDPRRNGRPDRRIGLNESVQFVERQFVTLLPQLSESVTGTFREPQTEIFIRQQPSDDELHGFLGHADEMAICAPFCIGWFPADPLVGRG